MMSIFFITLLSLTTSKIPINYIYKPLISKDTRFTKAFLSFNSSNVLIETDRPNFIIPVAKITELKKFTPISEKRLEITNSSIKKPFFKFTDFLITTLIKTLADEHFCFEISKEQEENNLEDGFVICSENESIFSEIEKIKKDLKEQEPGQQLEIQSINGLKRDFMVDVGDNREEKVFIGKNGIETQDGRVLFNLADIDAITQQLGNPCCLILIVRGIERSLCIKEISCEREKQIFLEKFHEQKLEIRRIAVLTQNPRIRAFVIDNRRHEFEAYVVIVEEKILLFKHRYDLIPAVIIDLNQIRSIAPLIENPNLRYFDDILVVSQLKGVNPLEKCLVVELDDKFVLCSRKINRIVKKIEEKPIYKSNPRIEAPQQKIIDKLSESSLNKTRIVVSKKALDNFKKRNLNITIPKLYHNAPIINNINIRKNKLNYSSTNNVLSKLASFPKNIVKTSYSPQKNVTNQLYQNNNMRNISEKNLKNQTIEKNSKNSLSQNQPVKQNNNKTKAADKKNVQQNVLFTNQPKKIDQPKSVFESNVKNNQKLAQKQNQFIKKVNQRKNMNPIKKVRNPSPKYQFYIMPGGLQINLSFEGNAAYKIVGTSKQKYFLTYSCSICVMKENPCCIKIARTTRQQLCSIQNNCSAVTRYAYNFLRTGCRSQKEEFCSFPDLVQNRKKSKPTKSMVPRKFK